jgi:hypothetical protein
MTNTKGTKMGAGKFARDKGQRGERAVIALLQPVVTGVYQGANLPPPILARNSMQSRFGGHDIVGLDWISLEIKNCETLCLPAWWEQTKEQAAAHQHPVLFYKVGNGVWKVRMYGHLAIADGRRVRCPVDISSADFIVWFEHECQSRLSRGGA